MFRYCHRKRHLFLSLIDDQIFDYQIAWFCCFYVFVVYLHLQFDSKLILNDFFSACNVHARACIHFFCTFCVQYLQKQIKVNCYVIV